MKESTLQNMLNAYNSLSNEETISKILSSASDEEAKKAMLEDLTALKEDIAEDILSKFTAKESGKNYINSSPVVRELFKNHVEKSNEKKDIFLGKNEETGETAIFSLLQGYITPYENEIIECITKFRRDGQVTDDGRIYFSLGQLYRSMRYGSNTTMLDEKRKEALAEDLEALRRDITFEFNEPLRLWGNFMATGGTYPILQFAKVFGKKINGQEIDTMYVVSNDLNIVNDISERLHMGQTVSQNVKAIKKDGKKIKLSKNQISLRNYLQFFVFGYIGARRMGKNYSPQMPYTKIFQACGIGEHRQTQKRAKEDIATILNYWETLGIVLDWWEYSNVGSDKKNGIEIRVPSEVLEEL